MILKEIKSRQDENGNKIFLDKQGNKYVMFFAKFGEEDFDRSIYIPLTGKFAKPEILETIKTWKVGDDVPVELYEKDQYKNFKLASKTELRLQDIERRLTALEKTSEPTIPPIEDIPTINPQENEVKIEDIPF
jgi:hypothetical protein